jgi:ATP-dependent DNA helicase RecQ
METVSYAESSACRRRFLLHYFGEVYKPSDCKNCDNCLHPKTKMEAMEDVAQVIEIVLEVKEKFKDKHILNILMGHINAAVKTYRHHELEIFGKGIEENKDEKYWSAVIRQAIVTGLLNKDIDNYGLLKVTKEGHKFLSKPHSLMITRDHDYDNEDSNEDDSINIGSHKTGLGADPALFTMLKDLVKQTARQKNLPPYVIFSEVSLEEMAIQYPVNIEELGHITGVGAGKAQKFGKAYVELIARYVEENEIDRPQDMIVKSVVNKSGIKVSIIQGVDRKLPLEDIAKSKGLKMPQLLNEMYSIVSSGTKLNISYYVNEQMDEDRQEEVIGYFKEAQNDSIEEALSELGEEDYSEEEMCLMRIKFISEYGN